MNNNNKDKETSWGKESKWYDNLLSEDDSYQKKVILPNLLRILNIQKGQGGIERVLDLGCGQGFFAMEVAGLGAHVTGIDISPELIKIAKSKQTNFLTKNIFYQAIPADTKLPFENNSFDKAFCVLALQNMKEIATFFQEVSRVLKEKGSLVLVLNHPAFRVPQGSDWGFDETKEKHSGEQYRKVSEYMSEKKVSIDMHPGAFLKGGAKKSLTYSFHRPLQMYFKYFAKNNFAVTRLEEWISHKESGKGPRKHAEDKARKEIPLFMMIEAKKV